jgi:DNA-binding LytR/AlgR family response regulator
MTTAPITALIADDEPLLAQALHTVLQAQWPALQLLPLARNGLEAAQTIAQHTPDVAFLDIQMPGLTGLEVAQGIEGRTRVVFVTAYDQYAIEAFDQAAIDYVLKPVKTERLARTVERVKAALAQAAPDDAALALALRKLLPTAPAAPKLRWIRASVGELMHQVDVNDVLYFEADEKYTVVRTTGGAEHLIRTPIVELLAQLDGEQFWQIHRSTVVNVAHLAGTRRDEASRLFVRMKLDAKGSERELPVSRAYVPLFKAM